MGEAVGVTLGDGLGEPFFLLLLRAGEGEGEFFGVGVTEGSGEDVGEAVGFGELVRFGDAVGVGELVRFGDGEVFGVTLGELFGRGDGVALFFFLVVRVLFRFFGEGVGSKMRLIFSPNDCA